MKIIDDENLIPNKQIVQEIVKGHPFAANLYDSINDLVIRPSTSVNIKLESNNDVTLEIQRTTPSEENYEYILYHEFGHVADQLNPKFKYSNEIMDSLTNDEKRKVKAIWNAWIDARLYDKNLLQLGDNDKKIWDIINGKFQEIPYTIEGKRMQSLCLLKNVRNAKDIIEKIWNYPNRFLSFERIIDIIRLNSP